MPTSPLETLFAQQLATAGLPTPARELRFHPERKWRFDFAWADAMVALEIEGGTWTRGAHSRGRGFEEDAEKSNEAALAGWTLLRVTGAMVKDRRALRLVERALARFYGTEAAA